MIVIAAAIIGILLGLRRAAKLGGDRRDKLQYAAVYGLIWIVLGIFVTVIFSRII